MSTSRSTAAPGRAVGRWTWRLFRRDWRAQLLVVALTVVTVAVAVVGASMAVESEQDPAGMFGRAAAIVHIRGDGPDQLATSVDAARRRFGAESEVIGISQTQLPGSVQRIVVFAQDPTLPLGAPRVALRDGRFPVGAAEVALTSSAAEAFGASLGDVVDIGRTPRTVVGIVENPYSSGMTFALVDPDGAPQPEQVDVLVTDPQAPGNGTGGPTGMVQLRDSRSSDRIVLVAVVVTMAMVLVGLIAAAGFVTIARRRQRQLGLLAAIGGSRRHLQWAMLACGTFVGITGAIAGTALGLVAWQIVRPSVAATAQHAIGPFELPWGMVAIIGVLAVLTSTVAAWWPARTASRIPVMAALSGRPVPPRPVHRPVLAGVGLVAVGAGAIALSGATRPNPKPLLIILGLPVATIGIVLLAPAFVGLTGHVAGRLPLAGRLAVRDVARHRSRAAASVAAITLAIGVSAGIVVVARANSTDQGPGNLAGNQLLVRFDPEASRPVADDAGRQRLLDGVAAVTAALGGDVTSLELDIAASPDGGGAPIGAGRKVDENTTELLGPAYVATPDVLAHYGIDPADVETATDLLVAERDVDQLDDPGSRSRDEQFVAEVRDELPQYTSAPRFLVTEAAMQRHGWQSRPVAWLLDASAPLTADQLRAARAAAADAGLTIEARESGANTTIIDWATRIGVILGVLIVLMAVALSRADAAGDDRILTANGARPRTRRAVAATTAATLGLLGALLGIAGTYVVAVATFRADLDRLWPAPWTSLLAIVVGLPVVAAAIAWCTGGGEPASLGRRPLD